MKISNIYAGVALSWGLASGSSFLIDKDTEGIIFGGVASSWLSMACIYRRKENVELELKKQQDKPAEVAKDRLDIM